MNSLERNVIPEYRAKRGVRVRIVWVRVLRTHKDGEEKFVCRE
jgi:hypothetical protein